MEEIMHWGYLFTSSEVQRLTLLTQRQLAYWDRSALVQPGGRVANGRGTRRLYTVTDLVQLRAIYRLREAGVSLQKIRRAFRFLATLSDDPSPLAELEIVTDGERVLVLRSDEMALDPIAKQFTLRLPLSQLLAEVNESVGDRQLAGIIGADAIGTLTG
jgi:DNA-binding transcriptional MerR regulator